MFETIGTPREKYLLKYNKKNSGEAIYYSHKMDEENKKEYNEIEEADEDELKINGSSLLNILVDRYKKKEIK